jgi:hypothetical protein
MEGETVSEILDCNCALTWLITQEDFTGLIWLRTGTESEPLGSKREGEFLDQLNNCQLSRRILFHGIS